jgi:hypothetical protein
MFTQQQRCREDPVKKKNAAEQFTEPGIKELGRPTSAQGDCP